MENEKLDNICQQSDEMEALNSIFGDQWQLDDETGTCSIQITKSVQLFINLIPDYPSHRLPKYELLAPEMAVKHKQLIDIEFKHLFDNGGGGPLIYQMIMIVEEIAKQNENNSESEHLIDIQEPQTEKTKGIIIKTANIDIIHGPIITDRKSVFQGHVCSVRDKQDVSNFMEMLLENRKIAQATHNISAYRITLPNNVILQDCDDDGEHRASGRLLDLLQTVKLNNVMVVVSRWYGGIQLGPDRFRHISNAARQALVEAGFIKS